MKKLVAIGGGENGRKLDNGTYASYDTKSIDEEIVRLTGKEKPNFLFICHAMSFSKEIELSYYETMKKIYGNLFNCDCDNLLSEDLTNKKLIAEKIAWADIIYEGGGDTKAMLNLWSKAGFDKTLHDAWENGKVICGISAGACCWFNSFNSDSDGGLEKLNGLNWINLFLTSHANENGREKAAKEELKDNNQVGLLLSNASAIEIIDDKFKILKSKDDAFAKKVYWKNNIYNEEILEETKSLIDMKKLEAKS